MGLYSEQLSGTAFTCPRASNQFSWLFRILPSAKHSKFEPYDGNPRLAGKFDSGAPATPNQCRWDPLAPRADAADFIDGIVTVAGAGDPCSKTGVAVHQYLANRSMERRAFNNADGDLLLVPQEGALHLTTEFGRMCVSPGEIAVIQRNIRFSVALPPGCDFIRGPSPAVETQQRPPPTHPHTHTLDLFPP
jgi:homogentisate 1,2-dioxygenase